MIEKTHEMRKTEFSFIHKFIPKHVSGQYPSSVGFTMYDAVGKHRINTKRLKRQKRNMPKRRVRRNSCGEKKQARKMSPKIAGFQKRKSKFPENRKHSFSEVNYRKSRLYESAPFYN